MKAITLKRPWVDSIVHSTNRILNRELPVPDHMKDKYIALHSSQKYDEKAAEWMRNEIGYHPPPEELCPTGIYGIARIGPTITSTTTGWLSGPIGWSLEDVRLICPSIRIGGQQGLWDVPEPIVKKLRGQWKDAPPGIIESTDRRNVIGMPDPDLKDMICTSIDVETTGLSYKDRIIQIAIVELLNHRIINSFVTFCNPGRPIPEDITKLTGIHDDMVRGYPESIAFRPSVESYLNRAKVIVGHNVNFDLRFLINEFPSDKWNPHATIVDSIKIVREMEITPANLPSVKKLFGIEYPRDHDAFSDACSSYSVAMRLRGDQPISTLKTTNLASTIKRIKQQLKGASR